MERKGQLPVLNSFKQGLVKHLKFLWWLRYSVICQRPGLCLVRHIHLDISLSSLSPSSSSWHSCMFIIMHFIIIMENFIFIIIQSPLSWTEDLALPAVTVNLQLLKGWNQSHECSLHCIIIYCSLYYTLLSGWNQSLDHTSAQCASTCSRLWWKMYRIVASFFLTKINITETIFPKRVVTLTIW